MLRCLTDFHEKKELDGEVFQHLVFVVRSVGISRPLNLVQFADNHLGTFMKLIASGKKIFASDFSVNITENRCIRSCLR